MYEVIIDGQSSVDVPLEKRSDKMFAIRLTVPFRAVKFDVVVFDRVHQLQDILIIKRWDAREPDVYDDTQVSSLHTTACEEQFRN